MCLFTNVLSRTLILIDNYYMGIASTHTREENEIYVFNGAYISGVIRLVETSYTLIRSCYIYELMNREAYEEHFNFASQKIVIY